MKKIDFALKALLVIFVLSALAMIYFMTTHYNYALIALCGVNGSTLLYIILTAVKDRREIKSHD